MANEDQFQAGYGDLERANARVNEKRIAFLKETEEEIDAQRAALKAKRDARLAASAVVEPPSTTSIKSASSLMGGFTGRPEDALATTVANAMAAKNESVVAVNSMSGVAASSLTRAPMPGNPNGLSIEDLRHSENVRGFDAKLDAARQIEIEAEKAKAAKESSANIMTLGTAATAAASGLKFVSDVLNELRSNREAGAQNVGQIRKSMSESLRDIGFSPKEATELIKKYETAGGTGLTANVKDAEKFLSHVSDIAQEGRPIDKAGVIEELNLLGSGKVSLKNAMYDAQNPESFGFRRSMRGVNSTGQQSGIGLQANISDAQRQQLQYTTDAQFYSEGQKELNRSAEIRANASKDSMGAYAATADRYLGGLSRPIMDYVENSPQARAGSYLFDHSPTGAVVHWLQKMYHKSDPPSTGTN